MHHREPSRAPRSRHRPKKHVATGPNQVWSWDITYLKAPIRGTFFSLYFFLDVWSRKIVGWAVHDRECGELATKLLEATCAREGIRPDQLVLHSDNGGPMTGVGRLVRQLVQHRAPPHRLCEGVHPPPRALVRQDEKRVAGRGGTPQPRPGSDNLGGRLLNHP